MTGRASGSTSAGIQVRYNLIKKRDEIVIPDHLGTPDNIDNVTLAEINSRAARHGLATGHVPDFVKAIADRNAYNPVADWIRSKPWDGEDRLPAIMATIVTKEDYPEVLKIALIRKWLRSAAAAALVKGYKGRGVLTLQGRQGLGKTSWVKSLVSDPALRDDVVKLNHHLHSGNKDSIISAVSNWIVEIGELESSFRKDIDRLKGFLTADFDSVRRPYDRRDSVYPRRTVFAAKVNGENFLCDTTGNTRWWTIPVEELDFKHDVDMQQLFAQLADSIEQGEVWWLNQREEDLLEYWNQRHRTVSAIGEKVAHFLDLDGQKAAKHESMTAIEVLHALDIKHPTNPQTTECAAALREILGESKRINGFNKWKIPIKSINETALARAWVQQTAPNEVF